MSDLAKEVMWQGGTEPPFTGEYVYTKDKGMYHCKNCGAALFSSEAKFDSGTGWPSFCDSFPESVELVPDNSNGIVRIEAVCKNCKGHLGHVFDDGPRPTGKRYCINSTALQFKR